MVTPQHTCILVNTTNTLGVEQQLEDRFPTNVVLSLVSGADLTQLGSSEFEHTGSTEIWVGPASLNSSIPESIQRDMSEALAMTLTTAQVDCKVSPNIKQQQFERMIGYGNYVHARGLRLIILQANCVSSRQRSFRDSYSCRPVANSWCT